MFRRPGRLLLLGGSHMDASAIQTFLGAIPGGGIAALAIWFAIRKDNQCNALMEKMTALAQAQATAAADVKGALDSIRDAIRVGTRS